MTKIEEFKNYFDIVESMCDAEIKWNKNIVTITLEYAGLKFSKMFDAEIVNSLYTSGDRYANFLFKDMLAEFKSELDIHGVDY